MSQDRIIYSFVLGWILLIAAMIFLDWLANPSRGGFRPKGERSGGDRDTRRTARARRRLEDDAAVRATLRDAYGPSSLRLNWTSEHEDDVRQIDDSLIDDHPDLVEVGSREVGTAHYARAEGDPVPNLAEIAPEENEPAADVVPDPEPEAGPDPEPRARGWKVGGDPLSLTAKGSDPVLATIRQRVWKNQAVEAGWSDDNRAALKAGKPPRRTNPITGRVERATVDTETGTPSWGRDPLDPFASIDD
ncbi:MAG: hypothetical protein ACI9C1_000213 [Candidatus Aldehydirespiratoraceae bacterium]|jgi:hypothetical protein